MDGFTKTIYYFVDAFILNLGFVSILFHIIRENYFLKIRNSNIEIRNNFQHQILYGQFIYAH